MREIYFDPTTRDICWRDPPGKRSGMLSSFMRGGSFKTKDLNSNSAMPLESIIELKRGIQTDIMKKVGLVDPECCLSIWSSQRSLDLTFDSAEDRNYFIRSIQALVYPQEIDMS